MKDFLMKAYNWLKDHNGAMFAFFIVVYMVAWAANALANTHFVLKEWEDIGKYILGKYGTDSIFNTPIPGVRREPNV